MNNTTTPPDLKTVLDQLETTLDNYLVKKAPILPTNIKEVIVKYAPYLSLIILIFFLPTVIFAFGLGVLLSPFAYLGAIHPSAPFSLTSLVLLISLVLQGMAVSGLFARQASGWRFVYYAALLHSLYSLLNFEVVNTIFGTLISLYLIFQVKSYYKN